VLIKFPGDPADNAGVNEPESRGVNNPCPNGSKLAARVAELEAACASQKELVQTQQRLIEKADQRIRAFEERLGQNSRNSHRPPSSDPPSAPKRNPKPPSERKPGGQIGHEGKKRDLLPPDQVDRFVPYVPVSCERCHDQLPKPSHDTQPSLRHQVADLPEKTCQVIEHQVFAITCRCGCVNRAAIPAEVAGSNFGPRLTALATFLVGASQVSRRNVEEIFESVLGVPVALGTISNMEAELTEALEAPYQEAGETVREADAKNLDETSWKDRNKLVWMWAAGTALVAYFVIHSKRGFLGLEALLGGVYRGVFTTDRWKAYGRRALRYRQICWAHLIRDFQKLVDRGGEAAKVGEKAKELAGHLFTMWNDFKVGDIDRDTLRFAMRWVMKDFRVLLKRGTRLSDETTATFCQNLLELEPALWTYLRRDGVEPTNNHAERILRRGVLWRKRSFGSRSDRGARFAERILTVVQTLRLQKKPVFPFLVEALRAHRSQTAAPKLCATRAVPHEIAA
jgi:transposase